MTKSLLTFTQLREANLKRIPQYKNKQGGPAHNHPEGRDWTSGDWMTAVTGEVGELAGVLKSYRRGDFANESVDTIQRMVAHEAADIVTYLDILCHQFGIDLGGAVAEKFNIVSERVGADVFLSDAGAVVYQDGEDYPTYAPPEPQFGIGIMSEDQARDAGWNIKPSTIAPDKFSVRDVNANLPKAAGREHVLKVGDSLRAQSENQVLIKWPRVEEMLRDWIFDHQVERQHLAVSAATPFIYKQIQEWAHRENLLVEMQDTLNGQMAVIWWSTRPMLLSGVSDIFIMADGNVKLTR